MTGPEKPTHQCGMEPQNSSPQIVGQPWFERHFDKIEKIAIWLSFVFVLYCLRSFLSLIFITFILTYTINSLLEHLTPKIKLKRTSIVILLYSFLAILIISMGMMVFPKVYHESQLMSKEIPEAKEKLLLAFRNITEDPDFARFVDGSGLEDTVKEKITSLIPSITTFLQKLLQTSFNLLLSLVFSFLIIWDLEKLKEDLHSIKNTRLKKVYETLKPMMKKFGNIVGRAFEAQIMIAFVNTLLTLTGLTILGFSSILFLSVFVFVCSFVPVIGMLLSSIPICLLAYKMQGFLLVFYSILMVAVIHFIEAYILNPRIVGAHFELSPFISVCILIVSESWFGVWGLLLGVPCAVFFYQTFIVPPELSSDTNQDIPHDKKLVPGA